MQRPILLYIFDLDNTLIDEKFYVLSKFKLLLDEPNHVFGATWQAWFVLEIEC